MARCVAFLRGINVGGHRVRNDTLARVFEEAGLSEATPFIGSGNVVFEGAGEAAAPLEARLEARLASELGYEVATFVRTVDRVVRIAALDLGADPDEAVHAIFLKRPADPDVERALGALTTDGDRFRVAGAEVCWLRRGRLSDSTIAPTALARALGRAPTTVRNLNTIRRIAARFG